MQSSTGVSFRKYSDSDPMVLHSGINETDLNQAQYQPKEPLIGRIPGSSVLEALDPPKTLFTALCCDS